jgi:hypothetical protein
VIDINDIFDFTSKRLKFHINYVVVGEGFLAFFVFLFLLIN